MTRKICQQKYVKNTPEPLKNIGKLFSQSAQFIDTKIGNKIVVPVNNKDIPL